MNRVRIALWVSAAVAFVWGSIALVSASDGLTLGGWVLYGLGGLLFAALSVLTGVALLVRGVKRGEKPLRIFPLPFIIQVAFLALVYLGVSLNLGFVARFSLSRPALEAAAAQVRFGVVPRTPAWIGLFRVEEVDRQKGAVRFVVGLVGMMDEIGVVYSPGSRPPEVGEDEYEHLQGPWWVWRRSW